MIKKIFYAYPSSTYADQYGHGKTGCYLVATSRGIDVPADIRSAHADIQSAIDAADTINAPWSPLYLAYPLPGHVPA